MIVIDTESIADSNLSSADTVVPEPETESAAMERREMESRFEEHVARSDSGRASSAAGRAGSSSSVGGTKANEKNPKEDPRSEMNSKHETRNDADDRDDTLAGFLGVDFERVVAFPLFF